MTLIELMVSVAIMAVIASGAFQVYSQLQRAHDRVALKTEMLNEVQRFWQVLQQDLSFAINRPVRLGIETYGGQNEDLFNNSELAFAGSPMQMQWSRNSALPSLLKTVPQSELRRVAYGLDENTLFRYQWRQMDAVAQEKPSAMAQLKTIEALTFRYGYVSNSLEIEQARRQAQGNAVVLPAKKWQWTDQWPDSDLQDKLSTQQVTTPQQGSANTEIALDLPTLIEVTLTLDTLGTMKREFTVGAPDILAFQMIKAQAQTKQTQNQNQTQNSRQPSRSINSQGRGVSQQNGP